jgi:hypothetical protein
LAAVYRGTILQMTRQVAITILNSALADLTRQQWFGR